MTIKELMELLQEFISNDVPETTVVKAWDEEMGDFMPISEVTLKYNEVRIHLDDRTDY